MNHVLLRRYHEKQQNDSKKRAEIEVKSDAKPMPNKDNKTNNKKK
ncbi:hypothetical protein [Sporosarcina sp. P17b]|nr:hypothetical protein [Sporosarcina sp. P17b]